MTGTPLPHEDCRLLGDLPPFHARHRPGQLAARFEGRETSYADFDRRTNRIAHALIAEGLNPGERVAYLGKNSDEFFELFFACAKAGVVLIPIGWRLAGPEIAYIAKDCEAKILFVSPDMAALAASIMPGCGNIRKTIAMEKGAPELTAFSAWYAGQPDAAPDRTITPDMPVLQLYTSGTTGRPKGAMLSHSNFMDGMALAEKQPMAWNTWSAGDVSLVAMPISHIGGTGWGFRGYYSGALNVVVREFVPGDVLEHIEKDGISKLFVVPAAIQFMLADPRVRDIDYSRLGHMMYGASPIPLDLLRQAMDVFKCGFVQVYGMTETTGGITFLPPEDHDPDGNQRMRSAGISLPGIELRVRDEEGNILPPGQIGELETRSPLNMLGYWNLGDATAETVDPDGWLRTGDAVYMDEDGYVFIQDRVKDMICSGGENVYPAEVESAIYGAPGVAEVAVIGIPDDEWGEAVKAVVVRKPGEDPGADDIIAFARQRIAGFKVPKSVDFIDALPRNPTGKILRKDLRAPYWEGRERAVN
ncbi:MAG: fatty acid--CoA ligase [Pacificimonas sp.]